jgi:hypothetical protein
MGQKSGPVKEPAEQVVTEIRRATRRRLVARIVGVGVETADMLVYEVLSRPMRD